MEHEMDQRAQKSSWTRAPFTVGIIASVLGTLVTLAVLREFAPHFFVTSLDTTMMAQDGQVLENSAFTPGSIPDVVARATPSVVSVIISADVPIIERYFEEYNPFGGPFGGFGFQVPRERQVGTEKQKVGGGSGFIVSSDGYIITNRHVVDTDGTAFSIVMNDGTTHDVEVVAKDSVLDIAVLKVKGEETFPALSFGASKTLRLGEEVIAIGNALAEFPNSVSVGVVSGLSRDIIARDMFGSSESLDGVIQTDAAINPGNSGGPLLNRQGEVIGVNVAVAGNSENIGFALPIDSVKHVFESVKEFGEIVRPYIGVRYVQITSDISEENNLPVEYGVLVIRGEKRSDLAVVPGSPADKAGLEENDIILEIDGKKLDDTTSFASRIHEYDVGDTVMLKILHDGDEKDVLVKLEKAPTD